MHGKSLKWLEGWVLKKLFPWKEENHIEEIWKEYRKHHAGAKHEMAPYEELKKHPGIQWPFVNGKETKWRFNTKYDPATKAMIPKEKRVFDFYGKKITGPGSGSGLMSLHQRFLTRNILSGSIQDELLNTGTAVQ